MLTKIGARVRGLFAGLYPENREDEQFHINSRGDQLIAQGMPELTEVVRLGQSWQVKNTTGVAAVTSIPTTATGLSLWNGESDIGKSYAIDSVGYWEGVVDATQSDQTALFCQLTKGRIAVPSGTAMTPVSLSGRSNYDGAATCLQGGTLASDSGWYPCGTSAPANVTSINGEIWKMQDTQLRGLYLVRPGSCFSLHTLKFAAAALQIFYTIRWHEVQVPYRS